MNTSGAPPLRSAAWRSGVRRVRLGLTGDGLGFAAVHDGTVIGDLSLTLSSAEHRHVASARVLEELGMRREGLLVENELVKGEWQSEAVYAALRASRGA